MKAALTAEEWVEFLDPANKEWAPLMYSRMSNHSAAATGLHAQPFGFTREDVEDLRDAAQRMSGEFGEGWQEVLGGIADRIEALLPPEGS